MLKALASEFTCQQGLIRVARLRRIALYSGMLDGLAGQEQRALRADGNPGRLIVPLTQTGLS